MEIKIIQKGDVSLRHNKYVTIGHTAARDMPDQSLMGHLMLAVMKYCTTLKKAAMTNVP